MIRKNLKILFIVSLFVSLIIFSSFQITPKYHNISTEEPIDLLSSTGLEGAENVIITDMLRNVNVSGSGVINIVDRLTILNTHNNPIASILVGIPLDLIVHLIFFRTTGPSANILFSERSKFIMNGNEMITIYFDSPIFPNQEVTIRFIHSYVNLPIYYALGNEQYVDYSINPFLILPYKTEKQVRSIFRMPESSEVMNFEKVEDIGIMIVANIYSYDLAESLVLDYLEPFLENIEDEERQIKFTFKDNEGTKMQIESVNREIFISAWGIIRIREEILIQNIGLLPIPTIKLNIPGSSKNVHVYDDIGDLQISGLGENNEDTKLKTFSINLVGYRAILSPGSKYKFIVEYKLPFEAYSSLNWFQQSVKINLMPTTHEFYVIEENIHVVIEGCSNIEFISNNPDAIKRSQGATILTYISKDVSPTETFLIQFTYAVDLFNLLLRPITFILIIAILLTSYVVIIKSRKKREETEELMGEFIPFTDIREFCSLYEEKNALMLEIRRAEDEAKRKKIAKKTYKNILAKNSAKIDQIKQEINPFKKVLIETNETFENIVKKLDILDAERISVDDSLNLLETRYKRGRLPSKAAYDKLSDDFEKRRKKIDRTIDKLIQQLRSYLL